MLAIRACSICRSRAWATSHSVERATWLSLTMWWDPTRSSVRAPHRWQTGMRPFVSGEWCASSCVATSRDFDEVIALPWKLLAPPYARQGVPSRPGPDGGRPGRGHPQLPDPPRFLGTATGSPTTARRSRTGSSRRAPAGAPSGPGSRSRGHGAGGSSRRGRGGTRRWDRRAIRSGACRSSPAQVVRRGYLVLRPVWYSIESAALPRKMRRPPAEQTARLRDPVDTGRPDGGAVLADREIERPSVSGTASAVALDEREVQLVLVLQRRADRELAGGEVDADGDARRGGPATPTRTRSRTRARPRRGRRGRGEAGARRARGCRRCPIWALRPTSLAVPSRAGPRGAGPTPRRSPRCNRSVPRPWRPPYAVAVRDARLRAFERVPPPGRAGAPTGRRPAAR